MSKVPGLVPSILSMKCPNCRKGHMFSNRSIFPFNQLLKMPEKCSECGQEFELEIGFYYGTGYVSYGITVALFLFNLLWYGLIFGITYKDNSIFYYLGISIAIVAVLQPWIMRISRVLYLNIFVKYGKGVKRKS